MYHSRIINETDFLNMSMTNGVGRSYKCELQQNSQGVSNSQQ